MIGPAFRTIAFLGNAWEAAMALVGALRSVPFCLAVLRERYRQERKWGPQRHPSHGKRLGLRLGPEHVKQTRARCETAARSGDINWTVILDEEVVEAFAEPDGPGLRRELVQVAAVAAAWEECIRPAIGRRR